LRALKSISFIFGFFFRLFWGEEVAVVGAIGLAKAPSKFPVVGPKKTKKRQRRTKNPL
jgi:hypothetical protein